MRRGHRLHSLHGAEPDMAGLARLPSVHRCCPQSPWLWLPWWLSSDLADHIHHIQPDLTALPVLILAFKQNSQLDPSTNLLYRLHIRMIRVQESRQIKTDKFWRTLKIWLKKCKKGPCIPLLSHNTKESWSPGGSWIWDPVSLSFFRLTAYSLWREPYVGNYDVEFICWGWCDDGPPSLIYIHVDLSFSCQYLAAMGSWRTVGHIFEFKPVFRSEI